MTTVTVKSSGGGYTSFVNAEATEQKTLGAAEIFYIEGYKGDYTSSGGGVNHTTENLVVAGWGGLAADAYVHIRSASTEKHTGIPLSGGNYTGIGIKNATTTNGSATIKPSQDYTRITGLIIGQPQTILYAGTSYGVYIAGNYLPIYVEDNIILAENTSSECGTGIYSKPHLYAAGSYAAYIRDNLICANDNGTTNGWNQGLDVQGQTYAYDNTCVICVNGIAGTTVSSTSPTVKNNISQASTADYSGTFGTEDYNVAADTSTTGANSQNSVTVAFNNPSSLDYSLNSSDTGLHTAGIGPSSDSNVKSTDIIGTSVSGATCSIGAFEYSSGAATWLTTNYWWDSY